MAPLTDLSRAFAQHQQLVGSNGEPISRTMQYRKVTKPLLERQRRARINRCLDELKDILVSGLQSEGENVSRLEKADILELTVRHLQKLQSQQNQVEMEIEEKFKSGFASCAHEVSRTLAMTPGIDVGLGSSLMIHLGKSLNQINQKSRRIRRSSSSSSCSTSSCDSGLFQTSISNQITPPISPNSAYFSTNSPRTTCYSPISLPSCSPTNLSMNSTFSSSIWRPF